MPQIIINILKHGGSAGSRLPGVRKVVALLARLGQPHLPPPLALLPHRRAHIVHAPLKQRLRRHTRRQFPLAKTDATTIPDSVPETSCRLSLRLPTSFSPTHGARATRQAASAHAQEIPQTAQVFPQSRLTATQALITTTLLSRGSSNLHFSSPNSLAKLVCLLGPPHLFAGHVEANR